MKHIKLFEGFDKTPKIARPGTFVGDDTEEYVGWTFDEDWNGYAVPYFEKDVADKIAADLGGVYKDNGFIFPEESDEVYNEQVIKTSDGDKNVFPIGAYFWVWEELTK